MRNEKGQALIEFIMILPILLLIMTVIFDIGNILYQKYNIQNDLDLIADYVINDEVDNANNYANSKKIVLTISEQNDLVSIKAEYKLKLNTPGLGKALGNPYKIVEEKKIIKNNKVDSNTDNSVIPDIPNSTDDKNNLENNNKLEVGNKVE